MSNRAVYNTCAKICTFFVHLQLIKNVYSLKFFNNFEFLKNIINIFSIFISNVQFN